MNKDLTLCKNGGCKAKEDCKRYLLGREAIKNKETVWFLVNPKGDKRMACEAYLKKDM